MDKLPSEKFILESLRKGNVNTFKQLFDQHYEGMVRFSLSIIHKPEIAEEIVQEVFERLWVRRADVDIEHSFSTYLYTAVRYRCVNYLKSRIRDFIYEDDLSMLDNADKITPHDELVYKDLEGALKGSLETLPEQCRLIFSLSRNSGMSNPEIAQQLGISAKTVENQITIALKKIRAFLQKNWYVFFLLSVWGCFVFHLTNY